MSDTTELMDATPQAASTSGDAAATADAPAPATRRRRSTGTGLNAIGMVSDGTPESKLDVPFRVELSGPEYFRLTRSCTSGQSGLAVTCGGALLLTGTPAP